MKRRSSTLAPVFRGLLLAGLTLSFAAPAGATSIPTRFDAAAGASMLEASQPAAGETSAPAGAAAHQVGQGGPWARGSKTSLERLLKLLASSGANAQSADPSRLAKLGSHLQDVVYDRLTGTDTVVAATAAGLSMNESAAVLVDIYVNGPLDAAQGQLEAMGMQVLATSESFGGVVEGYLPVDAVLAAAGLDQTKALQPITTSGTNTGSVTSQGDGAHNGPAARALGTNGAGVVVGVISDSMNQDGTGVAGSQGTGDLPATVTVLTDGPSGSEDEGRAMAEIIYDTAPGITTMYFSTGTAGPATKAASINALVSHGVDIIADDTFDLENTPFFQDGPVAQAVDTAYDAGVAYFVSSGNRARNSYEQDYRDTGNEFNDHDFDPGAGSDWLQTIGTVPWNACVWVVLQWDDPWGAATHDFDLYMGTSDGNTLLTVSADDNPYTGLPVEWVIWCNDNEVFNPGHTGTGVGVEIEDYGKGNGGDTSGAFLKYIAYGPGWLGSIAEYDTSSDAIDPDAASAKGAMTVGAVAWNDPGLNDPESYSSRGSKTRLFDSSGTRLGSPEVRQKPNIAGADCVSTSNNFAGGHNFGYPGTFCGTSAAAPSVAGVAALVLGLRPNLAPQQLYWVLANAHNTNDCTLAGNPDNDCGYGFSLADKAVAWAKRAPRADFDGNRKWDLAVYRPSNGVWYVKGVYNQGWGGQAGDIPVPGDYNGDGTADVAIYRPSTGVFYMKNVFNQGWGGQVGDVPVPGDYNGDGKTDVAIWRPSTGVFYVKYVFNSGWGTVGDIPVPGDYNGDGTTEVAVFHPSNNVWYIKGVGNFTWGASGDVPVPGDYNGDGTTDIAVWRPSTGTWYVKGQPPYLVWGTSTDTPVPGDYNGDGKTDLAVYVPSSGTWSVKDQFNTVWGAVGDYPVEAPDTNGDGDPYQ